MEVDVNTKVDQHSVIMAALIIAIVAVSLMGLKKAIKA